MNEEADKRFDVEEVDGVTPPPRARVDDAVDESASEKLERKKDYLEGFLAQQPATASPGEPGGDLYERVIDALRKSTTRKSRSTSTISGLSTASTSPTRATSPSR